MDANKDSLADAATAARHRHLRRFMSDDLIAEQDALSHIPDADRALGQMLEGVDLWGLIRDCKTTKDLDGLFNRASYLCAWLMDSLDFVYAGKPDKSDIEKWKKWRMKSAGNDKSKLERFSGLMFALGAIRGMQLGRELDTKTKGDVVRLLRHTSVTKLLLKEPIASSKEICSELDKYERLHDKSEPQQKKSPWKELDKQYGTWTKAVSHPSVRNLITRARRAAQQDAMFDRFLAVADGVGDEGSMTNRFRPSKYRPSR